MTLEELLHKLGDLPAEQLEWPVYIYEEATGKLLDVELGAMYAPVRGEKRRLKFVMLLPKDNEEN